MSYSGEKSYGRNKSSKKYLPKQEIYGIIYFVLTRKGI